VRFNLLARCSLLLHSNLIKPFRICVCGCACTKITKNCRVLIKNWSSLVQNVLRLVQEGIKVWQLFHVFWIRKLLLTLKVLVWLCAIIYGNIFLQFLYADKMFTYLTLP